MCAHMKCFSFTSLPISGGNRTSSLLLMSRISSVARFSVSEGRHERRLEAKVMLRMELNQKRNPSGIASILLLLKSAQTRFPMRSCASRP